MAIDSFEIYRGQGSPAVSKPERPAKLPLVERGRLTDPAGYKADDGLRDAVNVALHLGQPLLLTGEAGTGKTVLARSLSWELGYPLEIYETKSTSTANDLFYTYNALAQFHVAQLEARRPTPPKPPLIANPRGSARTKRSEPAAVLEAPEHHGLRFVRYNALGAASLRACPRKAVKGLLPPGFDHPGAPVRSVVLLDEIDKAPRDLPNDVLSAFDAMAFTVPELGNARVEAPADMRPVLVMTSNSEKALPDPFLRRCVFYHIPFPKTPQLREIVESRLPWIAERDGLLDDALRLFERFRGLGTLKKRPATAELLGWLAALHAQNGPDRGNPLRGSTVSTLKRSLNCLVKAEEDEAAVTDELARWVEEHPGVAE
jgi:MoxR-like ATPase